MDKADAQQGLDLFFLALESICRHSNSGDYALISLDYDNFNYINDLFGCAVGDQVLDQLERNFAASLGPGEHFVHLYADQFAFILRYRSEEELAERMLRISAVHENLKGALPQNYNLVCSGGVLPLHKRQANPMLLMDFATFARKRAKGNHRSSILFYDDDMLHQQQWRKMVTSSMEPALCDGEYTVFFQPKVLLKRNAIIGAEALVRWKSKEMGLIEPDFFLPIMEENGFVTRLDFFVLEQVCAFLRRCIEEGKPTLPVSVNFSKRHTADSCFAQRVCQTVDGFGLPHHLVEVEITEYSSSQNFQALIDTVIQLKKDGFLVSMDDFGKGYSSLGDLKNLPLDAIKFDRAFLQDSSDGARGKRILAKLVEMVKSLHIICIVEGVEEAHQAEFLYQLDCDIGQGYYFSRPIEMEAYEQFLQENVTLSHQEVETLRQGDDDQRLAGGLSHPFQLDSWEQYTLGKNIEMGLMKGRLDEQLSIQYANDKALEYLGYSRQEFFEKCHNSIRDLLCPEDREWLQRDVCTLAETGTPLSFQLCAAGSGGVLRSLKGQITCVADEVGPPIGLYAFQDITRELERTRGLRHSLESKIHKLKEMTAAEQAWRETQRIQEERYRIAFDLSDSSLFDWDFEKDYVTFSEKHYEMLGRRPVQNAVSTSPLVRRRIHPEDVPAFEQWVGETFRKEGVHQGEYRLQDVAGNYIWYRIRSTAICDKDGVPLRAVGSFSNIDAQKRAMERLTVKSQLDPLTHLLNKAEFQLRVERALCQNPEDTYAFFMVDVDDFKNINDKLGHLFGDTVLQQVAARLGKVFRRGDLLGRLGGDEFAVLMHDCADEATVKSKAERLLQVMHQTFGDTKDRCTISVSIGIAHAPAQGRHYDQLYHLADLAMYASKQGGKDCFTLSHTELGKPLLDGSI